MNGHKRVESGIVEMLLPTKKTFCSRLQKPSGKTVTGLSVTGDQLSHAVFRYFSSGTASEANWMRRSIPCTGGTASRHFFPPQKEGNRLALSCVLAFHLCATSFKNAGLEICWATKQDVGPCTLKDIKHWQYAFHLPHILQRCLLLKPFEFHLHTFSF